MPSDIAKTLLPTGRQVTTQLILPSSSSLIGAVFDLSSCRSNSPHRASLP